MKSLDNIINESIKNTLLKKNLIEESYVVDTKNFETNGTESISQASFDDHEGLYKNYVDTLNKISREIDSIDYDKNGSNNSLVRSLKIDEVYNLNGAYLHVLYFNNCYSATSKIFTDSVSHMRLERDFGEFDKWQNDFIACGLSAREGWVVTGYSFFLKRYINVIIDSHNINVPVGFMPIIVVDMWTHTYGRDFGTNKKSYLETQMKELNWDVIEKRIKKLEKMIEAGK
jgi:Fe-Mn family superoxide dismutase